MLGFSGAGSAAASARSGSADAASLDCPALVAGASETGNNEYVLLALVSFVPAIAKLGMASATAAARTRMHLFTLLAMWNLQSNGVFHSRRGVVGYTTTTRAMPIETPSIL